MWRDFWPSIRQVGRGGWAVVVLLLALLAGGTAGAWHVWTSMGDTVISTNGVIALVVGMVLTFLLGGGLMALVFYSARHGHDDIDDRDR